MGDWRKILKNTTRWRRFFFAFKEVIEPRFLYELIVPNDIVSIVEKISISDEHDETVFRFIIAASVFNGILVGLPGTLGWGVLAAQAVQVLMALYIARMVGLIETDPFDLSDPNLIPKFLKIIGATGITTVVVFGGAFKFALNSVWNVMGHIVPVGGASAAAAIVTTLFYGLFLYLAFLEIREFKANETLSLRAIRRIASHSFTYTRKISSSLGQLIFRDTPKLFTEVSNNIQDAWNGVINVQARIKGEIFLAGSLAYLLQGNQQGLEGPFGQLWLQAWRDAFSNKLSANADTDEIRRLALSYDADELQRVQQNVTSKFYEIVETRHENADGDVWSAELLQSQNHPVSDAIFFNSETGQAYEINYKFTQNKHYIESHIQEHPDVPVIAPPEVAEKINSPLVIGGQFSHEEISEISEENFDALLLKSHDLYLQEAAAASGVATLGYCMLPYLVAYKKGRITLKQLQVALKTFVPAITGRSLNRIAMLTLLGPVYGMFLLASFGMKTSLYGYDDADDIPEKPTTASPEPTEKPKQKKQFSRRSLITLSFLKDL